jgi:DNA (cytosine-5)-methyltransferase 1
VKPTRRPIGIDLFAGAGGLSLGFEQAGFDVAAAVEVDPIHAAVHSFNFPRTAVICASVEGLSGAAIRAAAGLGDQPVDCVFGGAPCQGFSLMGHRVFDDPRNRLVLDFVRIVAELGARTFVFENVRGLTVGRHKMFLNELVSAFSVSGYDVRLPWKVLNAGNFGTPQSRERLILFGARRGMPVPQYPEPITNLAGQPPMFEGLPAGPTCSEALDDLPDADCFDALRLGDKVGNVRFGVPSPYAAEMRCMSDSAWHFGYIRKWNAHEMTSSARTDHTQISRSRFAATAPGTVEPISRFFKLPLIGVSNTLRAGTDGTRGAFTSPRPIHFRYNRCITVREMARLHGFPDWFRLHATKWHGGRQIGNAVPPPLARAVASQVMAALNSTPAKPSEAMEVSSEELLTLNASGAATYLGVVAVPGRRDRKSGARKRKQIDIENERGKGAPSFA